MADEKTPLIASDLSEKSSPPAHGSAQVDLEHTNADDVQDSCEDSLEEGENKADGSDAIHEEQSHSRDFVAPNSTTNNTSKPRRKISSSNAPRKLSSSGLQSSEESKRENEKRAAARKLKTPDSEIDLLSKNSVESLLGEERSGDNLITWYQCLAHVTKGYVGTGILALPYAFSLVGCVSGPLFMAFTIVMAFCAVNFLVDACRHMCKIEQRSFMDYGDLVESVLRHGPFEYLQKYGPIAKKATNILLVITQLGFCAVYLIFMAQNLGFVLKDYGVQNQFDVRLITCCLFVPVALLCLIRNLAYLAVLSALANFLLAFGLGVIIYEVFLQAPKPTTHLPAFESLSNLPLCFGIISYSLEGIANLLPLENKMRKPEHFKRVLNIGLLIVFSFSLVFGILGYEMFGHSIQASITLNLPKTWYFALTKFMFAFVIFITYAIQFIVPVRLFMPWVKEKFPKCDETIREYLLRISLVICTFLAAIIVPKLGTFTELIGCFACSTLTFTLPAIVFHFSLYSNHTVSVRRKLAYKVIVVLLLVMGICGSVTGSVLSIRNLIAAFFDGKDYMSDL